MGTKYVKNNSNLYRHNSLDIQKVMWYCVLLTRGGESLERQAFDEW